MVSLEFLAEMAFKDPLGHRGRQVEGPCTSGGGRAPVHKSKALS